MAHAGKTALEHYQVGVIILSVVVLVQTILLVGALVKIVAYGAPKEIMALRRSSNSIVSEL